MRKTVLDEIASITMERPHVVLLGAGASRAAFPSGDRNGRRLPLMNDFLDIVPVSNILSSAKVRTVGRTFEDVYSELATTRRTSAMRLRLEKAILDYFSSLELPEVPTLYDHLFLSLRPKDVIASFNWDPFLLQAALRNGQIGGFPRIVFLHGNVLDAYCKVDSIHGILGNECSRCRQPFQPSPLLYPIKKKNYEAHPAINSSWRFLTRALKSAFMVTIFGYSAPRSDQAAMRLLLEAWGGWEKRALEQFEIIDIRRRSALVKSWERFIHTHHYQVHRSFYDSWIANHPRRTGEAYLSQNLEANFIARHPIPATASFNELWAWFAPLLKVERTAQEPKITRRLKRRRT